MRAIIIIALLAFLTSCKGKQTANESSNVRKLTEVRDSLTDVLEQINLQIEELGKESGRLSKVSTPDNPMVKNLEEEYLKLLVQKEEILLQLAEIPDHQ